MPSIDYLSRLLKPSIIHICRIISVLTLCLFSYGVNQMRLMFAMLFSELVSLLLNLQEGIVSIPFVLSSLILFASLRWY